MSLIHNEQAKLTATYMNGLAIGVAIVGGIAPIISVVSGTSEPGTVSALAVVSFICVAISVALHWVGRRLLKGLIP